MKNKKMFITLIIIGLFVIGIFSITILFIIASLFFELPSDKIAVIQINTPIVSELSNNQHIPTYKDYIKKLDEIEKDKSIKGVLLIINSPGGEVVASEKLARKVKELSEKKPVVSYVESLGTSGAYMVIAPTYIVAERDSIVGNIGVRLDIIQYYDLLKKIGINWTVIKAGKYKDIGAPYRPMTKEEKAYLERLINETYNYFVEWVSINRHIPLKEMYKIADGKIYSGKDALKVGLVDQVGTEKDAKEKIVELSNIGNISKAKFVDYTPKRETLLLPLEKAMYYLGYGIGSALVEQKEIINYGLYN